MNLLNFLKQYINYSFECIELLQALLRLKKLGRDISQDLLSRDVLLMFPNLIGIIIIFDCTMGVP